MCVAGVGLTITGLDDVSFSVSLVPHTLAVTTLGELGPGRSRQPRGRRARQIRRKAGISRRSATIGRDLMSSRAEYLDAYPELGGEWPFAPIEQAIADIREGRMVVVVDSPDRENEGDLVMAAQHVTPDAINFMATHGRGIICLSLTPERIEELGLEQMARHNEAPLRTAFTVSIEAREGVSTGVSAADRAHTIQVAINPSAEPGDLVHPGHVFPLRARPFGVLERTGQTEASVDLARLAGLQPAGVICEIMNEDGSMARVPDLVGYCAPPRPLDGHGRRPGRVPAAHREAGRADRVGGDADPVTASSSPTDTGP